MAINIESSQAMGASKIHVFCYGPLRTGKTTFACSAANPERRVILLSPVVESGEMSARFFSDVDIIRIKSKEDLVESINYIKVNHKKHKWGVAVLDSLTYYSDTVIGQMSNNGEKALVQRDWGLLDLHLQKWLLPAARQIPIHFIWIANEDEVKNSDGNVISRSPMLYGKTKVKFPGAADLIVQSMVQTTRNQQGKLEPKYLLKTISTDGSPVGGRFGPAFSDGIIPAHFDEIVKRVGPWIGESVTDQKT